MSNRFQKESARLPTLTIVIPNYNHGHLIGEQLRSIFSQSVRVEKILIVDDASTDDSVAVIEKLVAGRDNVEFICKKNNEGVVATVDQALRVSDTECLYFAAADDVILPGFLERSLELLALHPQAAICSTVSLVRHDTGESTIPDPTQFPSLEPAFLAPQRVLGLLLRSEGWMMGNATIYRRAPLLAAGGFPRDLGSYADGFVARALALRYGACFVPAPLAVFRPSYGGYSSASTRSLATTEEIMVSANIRMRVEFRDVFTKELISRSNARFLFGALRATFQDLEMRASAIVATVKPLSGAFLLPLVVRIWVGTLILALFCVLRFRDIPTVIRSRFLRWVGLMDGKK